MARAEVTGRRPRVTADRLKQTSGCPVEPMAYSIRQFSEAHNISVDTYFRMRRAGLGPATMKVGSWTLISVEAAAAWRLERERAARTAFTHINDCGRHRLTSGPPALLGFRPRPRRREQGPYSSARERELIT